MMRNNEKIQPDLSSEGRLPAETVKAICPVCGAKLFAMQLYDYSECINCGSYIYVSDKTAEEENMTYFETHFRDYDKFRSSKVKKFVFGRASKKDRLHRPQEYAKLELVSTELQKILSKDKKILDVGFGSGRKLAKWLEMGLDAYGVDLSENAVQNFKKKYPHHKERVFSSRNLSGKFDVISCDAVIEHIDDPGSFIDDLSVNMNKDGVVVIGAVPVLSQKKSDFTIQNDISFWRPCHRIVFSEKGLCGLFEKKSFSLVAGAASDLYVYRVLSLHLKASYNKITDIRNPKLALPGLPGVLKFYRMCDEAINVRSLALCGTYIFGKNR